MILSATIDVDEPVRLMGVPKPGERFDIDCVVGLPGNDLEILVPQVEDADRLGLASERLDVVGVVTLLLGYLV